MGLIANLSMGALPSTAVFEVRSTASDNNGGGFDSTGTGTDFSQQNAAHVTFNGSTITATTAGVSAVLTITGYTVAATDQGNFLQISGGTNFTTGIYEINSVNVGLSQWTLDRNAATAAGVAMTGSMGGAFATVGKGFTTMVVHNTMWVKATASYTLTSAQAISLNFTAAGPPQTVQGYNATRGDSGRATITTATNSINLFEFNAASNWIFINFIFSSTAGTPGDGWHAKSTNNSLHITGLNCEWTGFNVGINGNFTVDFAFVSLTLINSEVTASVSHGVFNSDITRIFGSYIHANGGDGYRTGAGTDVTGPLFAFNTIFKSNTGNGVNDTQNVVAVRDITLVNCALINNGANGLLTSTEVFLYLFNNIIDSNGTFGVNTLGNAPETISTLNNFYWNNTSGAINGFALGTGDVTGTGDPFVNRAGNNFALNNTAGAGAAARSAGFPGVLTIGGTGFLDIGPLQHQAAAGGGQVGSPIIQ